MKWNLADVLPSPMSFLTVTAMAIIGINLAKAGAKRWKWMDFGGLVSNT